MATECRRLRAVLSSSACQTTLSLQTGHNSVAPSRFDGPLRRQLMTLLFLVGCCPSCGSDIRNYSSGAGMPRPPCRADRSNPMSKGPCRTHPALREGIRTTERLAQAWRCATPSYKGRHQCRRQGVATNAGDKGRSTRWLKGRRKRVGGGNADRALLVPPSLADELTPPRSRGLPPCLCESEGCRTVGGHVSCRACVDARATWLCRRLVLRLGAHRVVEAQGVVPKPESPELLERPSFAV